MKRIRLFFTVMAMLLASVAVSAQTINIEGRTFIAVQVQEDTEFLDATIVVSYVQVRRSEIS